MAHNLDITNGVASFVSAREDAWHQLGTVVDAAMTAEEALRLAHLAGWNLRKTPLVAQVGDLQVPVPNRWAVVRDNPIESGQIDVLGDVGDAYKIVHNEDLTHMLETLVDESGAVYETAGALDGGKKVFVTLKLKHLSGMGLGKVDPTDYYLAVMTSHDGSSSTQIMVTPVRIVCQNTLNFAFKNNRGVYKVRHTVGAHRILVQEARETLGLSFDYIEDFQTEADKMLNTTLTLGQFEEIVAREFGAPEDAPAATKTRAENRIDEITALFADAGTHADVRNTVWAGLNAFTEWADHFSPVKGGESGADAQRSRKAILDPAFKNRAFNLMSALV